MPTIDEGNLRFTFPNDWQAIKYDDTAYYRNKIEPLGVELAAMDILCTKPGNNHLILIEIKDFRGYAAQNRSRQNTELVLEVMTKCMHTLAALYTVAYSKNIELRHFAEYAIDPLGAHDLLPPRILEVILFMEEDALPVAMGKWAKQNQNSSTIGNMALRLERLTTNTKIKARILNTSLVRNRDGFRVEHI